MLADRSPGARYLRPDHSNLQQKHPHSPTCPSLSISRAGSPERLADLHPPLRRYQQHGITRVPTSCINPRDHRRRPKRMLLAEEEDATLYRSPERKTRTSETGSKPSSRNSCALSSGASSNDTATASSGYPATRNTIMLFPLRDTRHGTSTRNFLRHTMLSALIPWSTSTDAGSCGPSSTKRRNCRMARFWRSVFGVVALEPCSHVKQPSSE